RNHGLLSGWIYAYKSDPGAAAGDQDRQVLETAGLRPEPEQLRLALRAESGEQQRTAGEWLGSRGVFQHQVFIAAQHRHTVDTLRNIGNPIVVDGCPVG